MKVTINYHDNDALTVEEVVRQAQHHYGKNVKVDCMPESTIAYDMLYFGLQQLLTHEQVSMLYDKGSNYQAEIGRLRGDVLYKVTEIIDQVIVDNEDKVGK